MLAELKFVQGAVAKKDLVPAMTHFRIESKVIRSFNGIIALCSPIDFEIDCTPKAETLVRAISSCEEEIHLSMTPNERLRIKSGKFTAHVETISGPTPHLSPEGDIIQFDGARLLQAFKKISPFIGNDASRPWTNGILLRDESAFATNNVCLIEYWLGTKVPFVVNIPRVAIQEMIRIDQPPLHAQLHERSVTFHYPGNKWLRTQLYVTEWPDIRKVLDKECSPTPVDPRLYVALENLNQFSDELTRVYIKDRVLQTHLEEDVGASYEVDGLGIAGLYQIKMLRLLEGVAEHADFTRYPEPILFYGENLRGAIVGMRM